MFHHTNFGELLVCWWVDHYLSFGSDRNSVAITLTSTIKISQDDWTTRSHLIGDHPRGLTKEQTTETKDPNPKTKGLWLYSRQWNLELVGAAGLPLNPDARRYTWRQTQPVIHRRLYFFLKSQSFLGNITSTDILPGFKTDHSMIIWKISLHSNPRGPGFWKLNTSLLADTNYIELIKLTIQQTREEHENDDSINPSLLWDMIKLKVREKSLSFMSAKKRTTVHKEQNSLTPAMFA